MIVPGRQHVPIHEVNNTLFSRPHHQVRLGARLAPDVYRGVAPVYLGAGGHSFVGPGTVVDHAVRMRRLPDEESAASLLAAGGADA